MDRSSSQYQLSRDFPPPPLPPILQSAGPSVCCSTWKRGRSNTARGASLCVCVPPTTTCAGFKASSVQPASGVEKLSKLTFRKKTEKEKIAKWAAFWSAVVGRYKKSVYKTADQNQHCLGSMYNSVCFIILSWVFAVLVFPGKTSSIPLFLFFVCLCLHPSVFLSVAPQLLLTQSGALLRHSLMCTNHQCNSVRLVGTSKDDKLIWSLWRSFLCWFSPAIYSKEWEKVPSTSHTCQFVSL